MSSEIVFRGKDYSKADDHKFELSASKDGYENIGADSEIEKGECCELLAEKYFYDYPSFPSRGLSPFNLGVYLKASEGLYATRYIGAVPLLPIKNEGDAGNKKGSQIIRISSRFGISATKMLETILKGDDFYNNPKMLTNQSYTATEWRKLAELGVEEDGPVFGVISGIGEIDLPSSSEGDESNESDLGMSEDAEGIFEIIDFINKAKSLCRKSLKKQSERKEENLACKVKGRILVQKQIRENEMRGRKQMVYCAYNTMSANIKENQIIKYALHLCQMKREIADSLMEDIRFCMNVLRSVPLKRCSNSDFIGLKNNGAYKEYKDVLNAAKKVMSRYKIAYDNSSGDEMSQGKLKKVDNHKTQPHFIDMNRLFEFYCRALFQAAVNKINGENEEYTLELESASEANRDLVKGDLADSNVFMKSYIPDIVIKYTKGSSEDNSKTEGRIMCVIDAKYSPLEDQSFARRERTHQILFYMKALNCNGGGLISPSKDNEGQHNKNYISGFMLIDGKDIGEERKGPQLCYLPLKYKPGEITKGEGYEDIIEEYLKDALKRQSEIDNKEKEESIKETIISEIQKNKDKYIKKAGENILDLIERLPQQESEDKNE